MTLKHNAYEYIHTVSIGDNLQCITMLSYIDTKMRDYFNARLIKGHQAYIIYNESDRWNNFLEADVAKFTNGRYPYLYVFVQPGIKSLY